MKELYPCTIIADRYSGVYSGGAWVAFPLNYENIPEFVGGGDSDEMNGWSCCKIPYGKGNSPLEAYQNLKLICPEGIWEGSE